MKSGIQGQDKSESQVMAEKRSDGQEAAESHIPTEHELDSHHDTLVKAEKIRADHGLMKHLGPHMEKKMAHAKAAMKGMAVGKEDFDGMKARAKKRVLEIAD